LAILFSAVFGLVIACTVRNIKEQVLAYRGTNFLALLSGILGLSAFQFCVAGFCSSAAVGLLSLLPSTVFYFFEDYSVPIIVVLF
jgi:hypothetical protein